MDRTASGTITIAFEVESSETGSDAGEDVDRAADAHAPPQDSAGNQTSALDPKVNRRLVSAQQNRLKRISRDADEFRAMSNFINRAIEDGTAGDGVGGSGDGDGGGDGEVLRTDRASSTVLRRVRGQDARAKKKKKRWSLNVSDSDLETELAVAVAGLLCVFFFYVVCFGRPILCPQPTWLCVPFPWWCLGLPSSRAALVDVIPIVTAHVQPPTSAFDLNHPYCVPLVTRTRPLQRAPATATRSRFWRCWRRA